MGYNFDRLPQNENCRWTAYGRQLIFREIEERPRGSSSDAFLLKTQESC